jgi:hypothetical protein
MKLAKSLLLGSAAALVATAGANAADLPSRKAAPVQFVQVCTAYGAGFFTIPGTDTCLKMGGRVRADYAVSALQNFYSGGTINQATGALVDTVSEYKGAQSLYGSEVRARVDFDARTPTAYGTVQTVASLRLARTAGTLAGSGAISSAGSATPTLEAAFVRFAGFTFGISRDNFSFMPSIFYGAGHWSSFANGANQIAYTAVLGGGFSATLALQDRSYTTAGGVNGSGTAANSYYRSMPQVNARVDWDQSWGSVALTGAVGQATGRYGAANAATVSHESETVWAVGVGTRINLPMIAAGDALWLTAAYADGMTEYTTNWFSNKTSDTLRNVGGYAYAAYPSWVYNTGNSIDTVKSWVVAGIFQHFWTPQWRHSFVASYGQHDSPASLKALSFAGGGYGDSTVWNLGSQIAFVPTRNFEIGLEIMYARTEADVRRTATGTGTAFCAVATDASCVTSEKLGNWTGRLRVERTF